MVVQNDLWDICFIRVSGIRVIWTSSLGFLNLDLKCDEGN